MSQKCISIPNNNFHGFTFKVIPNAVLHPSLAWFYARLEALFWNAFQVHRYSPLNGHNVFKTIGPLEQGQVNREIVPACLYSSRPRTVGCSRHCEQIHSLCESATSCRDTTLVSSHALREANTTWSLCRLAVCLFGPVARTHNWRCYSHWRLESTWHWRLNLTVLVSFSAENLDSSTESSRVWFPGRIKKTVSHHQWWLS